MPNTTSASLKLTVQATGENSGTWGQITNTNLLILEQAIGGYAGVALNATTGATLTFSNGALSDGKNQVLKLTGTITANVDVIVPDSIEKTYVVENATSGAFTVTVKTTSGSGVTWGTTDKGKKLIYSDGTDILEGISSIDTLKVSTFTSTGIDDNATSTAITIDSSENVGIGTTSPTPPTAYGGLHINSQYPVLKLSSTTSGTGVADGFTVRINSADDAQLWHYENKNMSFATNNTERMRIDSSGKVSIGDTTSSGYRLKIKGTLANDADDQGILLEEAGTGGAFIKYDGAANLLKLGGYNAGEVDSISIVRNTGDVGIGTTSPDAKLSVNGVASFGDGTALLPSITNFGDLDTGMFFPAANQIGFATSGDEIVRIGANGAMSIGTNDITTDKLLVFNGTGGPSLTTATGIRLGQSYNAVYSRISSNFGGSMGLYAGTGSVNAELSMYINDTIRMRLNSGGALLLGTTTAGSASAGDLVVNGGIFLGGSAAANELDDYEEGTHTPTVTPGTSGTLAFGSGSTVMSYIKIGNRVFVNGYLLFSTVSSAVGSSFSVTLPFAVKTGLSSDSEWGGGAILFYDISATTYYNKPFLFSAGNSFFTVYMDLATQLSANDRIAFSFSYQSA
jgi:hypothetical protein